MPSLGELVARLRLRDDTDDGVASAEERLDGMFRRLSKGAAAVGIALARGIIDAAEDVEQRFNTLEQRLARYTPFEEGLAEDLTRLGFDDQATTAGVQTARRFGGGLDFAEDIAALETAGINTRFVPQLAQAFGLQDPSDISDQLNAAFDVATRSGIEPEELFSEIADNTEVYSAFGSIPQAVDFLGRQSLIPSETTIQLETGALVPDQFSVDADIEALSTISPSFGERAEGRLRTRPAHAAIVAGARAVPIVGDIAADIGTAGGSGLAEFLGQAPGNREQPADVETFDSPIADLLLLLETRDAVAQERVAQIANRIDLDRRSRGSSLDIPG